MESRNWIEIDSFGILRKKMATYEVDFCDAIMLILSTYDNMISFYAVSH